jgi:tripartite-type tricarboxylate transporter receptor subunit TctC
MRVVHWISAACAVLAFVSGPSMAQSDWPTKGTIKLVYPFPPGGSDGVVRLFGERLSQALGTPVIVDNKGGAGGNIGGDFVAHAPADGYTLLVGTNGPLAINPSLYREMKYNPQKDFVPITGLVSAPQVLFVNPAVPANSVAELIAYSKAKPTALTYGSVGQGSASHLTMELFKSLTGAQITHVPYKGAGPAITDVIGGQISMMTVIAGSAMPHVKSGKVRALATTGAKQSAVVPGVSTLRDQGIPLDASAWLALVAPTGTPKEILARLNTESAKILKDPAFVELITGMGFETWYTSPDELAATMRRESEMWGKVIKDTGAKVD